MSLYAIRSDTGLIKVGITESASPLSRLASLQTGNPHRLSLLGFIDTEYYDVDHRKLEAMVHQRLARFRSVGEWFAAPDWVILRVMAMSFVELHKPVLYARWERRFGKYCRLWLRRIDNFSVKS